MKKVLYASFLILSLGFGANSFAQTAAPAAPKLFLTWSSNAYVPAGYAGKALPTANSQIIASVELIDGGKPADLSKQNVYWYVNNKFISGGIGMQSVSFRAPDVAGDIISLMAEVPNYSKGDQLKTVNIPIAEPEAVIEMPFPSEKFSSSPVKLAGQPYFFNAGNLSRLNFKWSVNNKTPSGAENPQNLSVKFGSEMSPGAMLSVSFLIQNLDGKFQFERASKGVNLIYSP